MAGIIELILQVERHCCFSHIKSAAMRRCLYGAFVRQE